MNLILLFFMERYLNRIGKNLVVLGGKSCSSCQEPGSDAFNFVSRQTVLTAAEIRFLRGFQGKKQRERIRNEKLERI
jgi:hypothetical protein